MKFTIYFFQWVWSGLLSEHEPVVTSDEKECFAQLTELLTTEFGFRKPKRRENLDSYLAAFHDFEYRYRNEFSSISKKERKANIADERLWNTEDNELNFHKCEVAVNLPAGA